MRQFLATLICATMALSACQYKPDRANTVSGPNDTLLVDTMQLQYTELMESDLDSAARIQFLADFSIQKLSTNAGRPTFDTTALFNGYLGRIRFYQGNILHPGRETAVVQVHDNEQNPFMVFTKDQDSWRLKQVLYGVGVVQDSATHFYDYNFDGYTDLAIIWNYSAGRCSCTGPGCRSVFLYDAPGDSLREVPAFTAYLDFGVSEKEKVLFLGEHCDGFFGKFRWSGDSLVKVEAYIAKSQDIFTEDKEQLLLTHQHFRKGTLSATVERKGGLPVEWEKAFGW